MASAKTYPTVDEAVSLLKKSDLPTVITEGRDDYVVFRRLEDELREFGVDVLPLGNRDKVLQLYGRRAEIGREKGVAYVADRDAWIFNGIPLEYVSPCVIFSHGYSIENDLYADGPIYELMTDVEKARFSNELDRFLKWYALAVSRHLVDSSESISTSPFELFQSAESEKSFTTVRVGESYPEDVLARCRADYVTLLRGKSLLALSIRQLLHASRNPKYSKHALMEQCVVRWGPKLSETREKLKALLT